MADKTPLEDDAAYAAAFIQVRPAAKTHCASCTASSLPNEPAAKANLWVRPRSPARSPARPPARLQALPPARRLACQAV